MTREIWTGGCQCGAVRYRLLSRPTNPCLCHCRMCQKQFGSFFGAFADVHEDDIHLVRGAVRYFKSSSEAERGFCGDCGTPLVYHFLSQPRISVAIGSLDRHSEMKPEFQYGLESREPWFADLHSLPGTRRSCPDAWCNWRRRGHRDLRRAGIGQAAMCGRLTVGVSLKVAMVSRLK